ncbi:DNA polymerase delta catalytic subunit [Rozella allomycis CSF55]|uniref:DNA polymerase n=1 Tax=Rozella allomycis (strain CSF55) TaxID=988480 RepID=A0A4P9YHV6_ROZAC|nr:DNA polymerase delta catalytic subunit [Rozella allomycis CSF55]
MTKHSLEEEPASSRKKVCESTFEKELERLYNPEDTPAHERWERPKVPDWDSATMNLVFQQIEIDDYKSGVHDIVKQRNSRAEGLTSAPVLRLYGVTSEEHSVVCHVHGFFPYLYVAAPNGFSENDLDSFKVSLEQRVGVGSIVWTEIVKKENIYGYHGDIKSPYIKIVCSLPTHVNGAKRVLEGGMSFGKFMNVSFSTFESNLGFIMRFMIDCEIRGMSWIELQKGKYTLIENKNTPCQLEVEVYYEDLTSHLPEGEWQKLSPLRILSFDIECAGRKGVFPDANEDSVIQIANMVTVHGQGQPFIRNVFTLKSCAHIVGSDVYSFETEEELLMAWKEFFVRIDADVIVGYNISNFDWPYLLDRAKALKLEKFNYLGRISESKTIAKDTTFSSKAYGTRESKALTMEGRLHMDMLQVIQRDYKLRSYTLNSVCAHFLGEQKEDVQHSIITDLQNGNEETRRRLAVYCLKDAVEVTEEQYEGATVIEPIKGYYDLPIATLDFASLYPSIMMAHNLCYSTLLNLNSIEKYKLNNEDYIRTPSGDLFLSNKKRKGLLPIILEELISARKRAKNDLKNEKDPFKRAVLDGRQLALKISANSVYGFTGATIGKLPCIQISQSVTSFGRMMIEKTKLLVEEKYTIQNGYKFNAKVIYGDTDSVMVKFGVDNLKDAMDLGNEAAKFVSSSFINPIKLEFEKVYFPYLLINKKRYAGLYWTNPDKYDKMDTKGIETVRRDNCRLVQVVIDTCLRMILIDRNVQGAKNYAKQVISDLLQNKIDLSQLVITKALSKTGDDYANKQAHAELAERMKKRDAGSAPNLGDRVAYVIIQSPKGSAAYEKSEDPIYVLEHNLPIDTKYYLNNQLAKPLLRIFEPIMKNPNELLTGDHTRVIQVATSTNSIMSKFTVKKQTCLGCKAPLKNENVPVCKNCIANISEIYNKHLLNLNELEIKFARLWTQCQRCQGSLHQEVLCSASDCPIFYMRKRVAKDVQVASKSIDRFNSISW